MDTSARDYRRGRTRALLAGGLVIGLGTVASLAVFTDPVFSFGSFDVGTDWQLEGSVVRSTPATDAGWGWKGSPADPGDELDFQLTDGTGTGDHFQPGKVMYAPYTLRVDPNSPDGGTISLEGGRVLNPELPGASLLFTRLWYSVREVPKPESCNDTWWGKEPMPPDPLTTNETHIVAPHSHLDTPGLRSEVLVKPGDKTTFCFRMSADPQNIEINPPDLPKYDKSMVVGWTFKGQRSGTTA